MSDCLAGVFDVHVKVRSVLRSAKVKLCPSRLNKSYGKAVTADWLALGLQK
jgi:hypothetical protein